MNHNCAQKSTILTLFYSGILATARRGTFSFPKFSNSKSKFQTWSWPLTTNPERILTCQIIFQILLCFIDTVELELQVQKVPLVILPNLQLPEVLHALLLSLVPIIERRGIVVSSLLFSNFEKIALWMICKWCWAL